MNWHVLGTILTAALVTGPFATAVVQAQDYPNRPIRLIVPFSPGGTTDVAGRLVGAKLSKALGQPVVIDNRGGAGSTIGTNLAAKSSPDGHTVLLNHVGLASNATLYPNLPYDALKDLSPVSMIGVVPNALVVNNALPAKNLKELIALAKAQPGKLAYGSSGVGSSSHLVVELLEVVAGVKFNHVPYKGGGASMIALMGGQIQFAIPIMASAVNHVKAGRIRMLAVTSSNRVSAMPDVPTMAEAGVARFEHTNWFGIFVPAGTPKAITARLNQAIVKALETVELREKLTYQGLEPQSSTPEELSRILHEDTAKWAKIINSAGIRIQ